MSAPLRRWIVPGVLGLATGVDAQMFEDISRRTPVPLIPARAVALADVDSDGRLDLFLAVGTRTKLLVNQGQGRFADASSLLPASGPGFHAGGGAVFGDFDNDGDADLFVPVGRSHAFEPNVLLRNDRGRFTDVTVQGGLTDAVPTDNAVWLDFDRDGWLDVYAGSNHCFLQEGVVTGDGSLRNRLYRNRGDGAFDDFTAAAGLDVQLSFCGGSNGGIASADLDLDGWPDLYVGVWKDPNRLFLSDGQGGFRDVSTAEIADDGDAFNVAVGDIDNDGRPDIFQAAGGDVTVTFQSLLLLNVGGGTFLDVRRVGLGSLGTAAVEGAALGDFDGDGDLDLLTARPHALGLNRGNGTFDDATDSSGIDDVGFVVATGDVDGDGSLDLVFGSNADPSDTGPAKIYRNRGGDNHWLRVDPVGTASNRDGIGARIVARAGDLVQTRQVLGGRGREQDETVAHFGLGLRTRVDTLTVHWPSGQVDVLTDLAADRRLVVVEGQPTPRLPRTTDWVLAPAETLFVGRPAELAAVVRPGALDDGESVMAVTADLRAFGGPSDAPLQSRGDGTWELRHCLAAVTGPNRFDVLGVLVERGAGGPHWTRLSRHVVVLPGGDLTILGDGLGRGWRLETDRGVTGIDHNTAVDPFEGVTATAVHVESARRAWTLRLVAGDPPAVLGYEALQLAIRLGGARGQLVDLLGLSIDDFPLGLGDLIESGRVDIADPGWQTVRVPLALVGDDPTVQLESIALSGTLEGTIYLDDVRLIAALSPPPTAVAESHEERVPDAVALHPNYPNPFNSGTVLSVDLPRQGRVDLGVYNLAGQRVVTLAAGWRAAGSYRFRWDGTDASGRALASGVYLSRLEFEDRVDSRRLLLLR